ncbi:hypothetical protein BJY01DRAFT_14899 [Aspergillus pseudoustus]|uniref:EH domain-containing protein n=1 Tax=Aspergillus pseudoustus TaxID=1810923 RepID=A0ABR4JLQ2_9EURO
MAKPNPSRDRHLSPRNVNQNHSSRGPSPAALQGALLAFNNGYVSPPVKINHSPIMDIISDPPPPMSLLDSDPDPPPELPLPGSIRDKIAKFSAPANSTAPTPNNRPSLVDISREKSPQLLAAEIAVGTSPAPSRKTTHGVVQRAESQRIPPNRGLPSPVPVRKAMVNHRLLNPSLDGDREYPSASPSFEQKSASPIRSTSPQSPPITKPRPVPPAPRKSASSTQATGPSSLSTPSQSHKTFNELPNNSFPLRPKASASTLSEEPAPALPPRRAANVPTKDTPERQLSSRRAKSPAWQSGSSVASFYSQSQNPSSSSMLDSLPDMNKDGPSDAVAASSLASSRALQSRKSPPPPPPTRRRRSRSRSLLQLQHQSKKDRAPPSPRGLRETLRTQSKSDDEDEHDRRHRRRVIHKHPHKHQEGDRRRWRSEIAEKERKRYEGVWAANKGLLIHPSQVLNKKMPLQESPSDMYPHGALEMVVNLVVQDIWSRSHLPDHVLEQIWNLVDGQKIGLLTRAEFVVGMWLIDQQLKGHKLPGTVPESVWASVFRTPGISLDDLRP